MSRSTGIIIKENKILLIHRIKNNREYFVIPGGTIEEKETPEETLIREIKEETNLEILEFQKITEYEDKEIEGKIQYIFLIKDFFGNIQLGGPELKNSSKDNIYILEWHNIKEIEHLEIYPQNLKEIIKNI